MLKREKEKRKKNVVLFVWLGFVCCFLSSCDKPKYTDLPVVSDYYEDLALNEKKSLKLGVVYGPYGKMFKEGILPVLEKKGYTVELIYFDDYIKPNVALANYEVDLNMHQHYRYLNNVKFENNLSISAIVEIPTASMGLYSSIYQTVSEIPKMAQISLPNDPTNLSRAIRILNTEGLIKLDPLVDRSKATLADVIENPHQLQFTLMEAQYVASSRGEYDLSVINGNFAIVEGLLLSDALCIETLEDYYYNVIAVRTEDLAKQFTKDIIAAVRSEFLQKLMANAEYSSFQCPPGFFQNWPYTDREK